MKVFGLAGKALVGAGLLAAALFGGAQTTRTQVITVKSTVGAKPRVAASTATQAGETVDPQTAPVASGTKTVKVRVKQVVSPAALQKALVAPKTEVHANKFQPHFLAAPTVVNSVNFGSAEVGGRPVTMTLNYPVTGSSSGASISPGISTTVANGAVAPGSASDYIFFGNSSVEFGQAGGGQPSNLTNFTVSTVNNVEYPGNGNYTRITAPGGSSSFTTGTVTENPTNYPNTTPHTQLLATFSPLKQGTFTVFILDANTDGVYVGNSSVAIGVNGGAPRSAPTHFLSGTNEFTQFTVSNASPTDEFEIYATTSTNAYPTIGGLTFTAGASGPVTANTTASTDFAITSSSCSDTLCSATVTFTPGFPGLRYDAVTLTDGNGNAAYETYVYGTGMAPQFRYELGGYTEYINFFPSPLGVTIGPDETVYFTSTGSSTITIAPHLLQSFNSITLNGLAMPSGIAVDGSNTLYVADQQNNDIISYTAAGVQGTVKTSPLSGPSQIAVDGTGALYIADTGHGRVIKIDNQGNETTLVSGLTAPQGVAVDSAGDVFYTDTPNGGEYFELPVGSTTPITMSTNINQIPNRLAVDASGTVYMTTDQALNLFRPGNQQQYGATGVDVAFGVAVDRNGDVLLTNPLKNIFSINDGTGGNFILNTPPGTTAMGGVTVANTGNETLTFSSFVVPGPVWTLDPSTQCGPSDPIGPAQTCDITTDFTPPLAQNYNSTVIATSNSLNNAATTDTYTLYGYGTGDASTTTVTASPNPVAAGNPVTLSIGVSDNTLQYTPSGTVTIMDGSSVLGTATLIAGGSTGNAGVQFVIPSLTVGSHDISVSFPGDLHVSGSTSNHVTVVATDGAPPISPNGNVMVSSQNFGSVVVQQNKSMTFVFPTGAGNPNIVMKVNQDFAISSSMCNVNCSVTVTFTPQYPGLRSDVVTVTDTAGHVLARTFVYGVGTGGLTGFDPGTDSVYSRIQQPTGVTVGPDGSVYITDPATKQVFVSNVDQATPLPITNLGTPAGVAVDANRTVYVADQTNNVIVTYNLQTQVQGTVATSQLSQPTGVAVDGAGSLYVTDTGNARVIKVDSMGVETVLASDVASLGPITLDSAGDVFYATTSDPGVVMELPAGGGSPMQVANNISNIHGIAVDASGKLYYTNDAGLSIIAPGAASLEGYALAGLTAQSVSGVALDSTASIYVTQPGTGTYVFSNRTAGNTGVVANVGGSSQASITVSNNGNADVTSSIALNGSTAYSLDSSSTCSGMTPLSKAQICSVVVDYAPLAPGQDNADVEFVANTMNASGNDDIFDLFGQANGGENAKASSTTTLTVDPNAVQIGGTVRFLARVVSGGPGSPSGSVSFSDGTTTLATVNLSPGANLGTVTAEFDTTALAVGTHSITASYSGDSATQSSTSNVQRVVVTTGAPPLNGGVVQGSQNFGSVAVGQTISMNVVFAAGAASPSFATGDSQDFTVTSFNCGTTCVVSVKFAPIFPGARMDALTETDNTGAVVAKTFVYGTGTGPLFGFDPGSSAIDHDYQQPTGIAVGQNGVAYVSDTATNQVFELASGVGALPILNLGTPAGVAVDGGNMIYVVDQSNNVVVTYNPGTNVQGMVATSPLSKPSFVAVDGTGAVYISDTGNSRLIKVDNQGRETTLASGLNSPQGVAVDAAGDVFYADGGSAGEIVELPAGGGQQVSVGTSLGTVTAISLDASGSVNYTGSFSGVRIITPGKAEFGFTGTLTGSLTGIALGPNGDIYTTQASSGTEEQLSRASMSFNLSTPVGVSVQQPGPQVFNTGNAPLTISNIALTTGTVFTIDSASVCKNGTLLGPGQQCNTLVDFLPPAAQSYSDTLTFTSNSNNVTGATNVATENGTGAAPQAPSTTTLAVSSNSTTLGQSVTFTATVSDTINTPPGGTVNFLDGTTVIGSVYLSYQTSGEMSTAQFSTSSLAMGSHSITAMYVGEPSLQPSTSAAQTVTVGALAPPPVNSVNFGNVAVGQTVSMNFTYTQGTNPTISASNNTDFVVSTVNCLTGCMATVTFAPQYPGLRDDAVTVTDSSGNVLAKTFVYGVGTAPRFGFDPGTDVVYSGTLQTPFAATSGPNYFTFISDTATNQVYGVSENGDTALAIANLGTPSGIAFGGGVTLYVADSSDNVIVTYNAVTHVQGSIKTTPLSHPNAVVVDGTGAVYVSDNGNNRIIKIDNQGNETTLASGLNSPQGIALDSAGDVFYADQGSAGEIVELPVTGGLPVSIGTSLGAVHGLAVDASGKIYYTNDSGLTIVGIEPGPSFTPYPLAGLTGAVNGVALDPGGSLYVTQPATGEYVVSNRTDASNVTNRFQASVGSTSSQHFTISNNGNAPLTISSVRFTGSAVFTLDPSNGCGAGTVVAAGQTCNVVVNFTPTQATAYSGSVLFASNSLNDSQSGNELDLFGNGSAAAQGASTTTLALSSNSIMLGQSAVLTATVTDTSSQVTPTGTVNFQNGGTIGSATLSPTATPGTAIATYTYTPARTGGYFLTAMYVGDTNVSGSMSAGQTLSVTSASTTTTLMASAANLIFGQNETLTATISGFASPAMTGTVSFFDGARAIGSSNVTSTSTGGTATLSFTNAPVGSHSFTATYNADGNYLASTGQPVTVVVTNAVVNSQNFGSVAVGQTISMNVVFSQTAGGLYFTALTGSEFSVTTGSCSTTCTATVKFSPKFPGVREDAITVTDGNGLLLAKAYVYGIGTGPQLGFDPGMNDTYSGSIQAPTAVAIGPFSTEYFTDTATAKVWAVAITGSGTNALPITGLVKPVAVAVDGGGIVYVVDQTNNDVVTYNTQTQTQGTLSTTGLSGPNGVAVDGAGNVYISDLNNNRIVEVNNQGTQSTLLSGLSSPQAVAVDSSGDVFYADLSNGSEVSERTVGGSTTGIVITQAPIHGLALDASGKVYYTDNSGLHTFAPGGASSNYGTSLSGSIAGVAVGPEGNIYVAQPSTGKFIISVRGTSQGYPTAAAGSTTDLPFVLTNTGNAPLTLSKIAFTTGTPYALDPLSDCGVGSVVAPGQGCEEAIDFTPPAAQSYTSAMTVTSNNLNVAGSTNVFNLYGTGTTGSMTASTTTLTVSSGSVPAGQPLTLTATVSDTTGVTPTGMVNFLDGTTFIGSMALGTSTTAGTAQAQITTSTLGGGPHTITAMYVGDTHVAGSTSTAQSVTVTLPSTTTLSVSSANVMAGQPVRLTATVTVTTQTPPGGTVRFLDGTTVIGSSYLGYATSGNTASAAFTTTTLAVGPHSITAVYGGDSNYQGSTSATQNVTVSQATTSTSLTVSAASITVGQTETLTATVTGNPLPGLTGMVTFFDGMTSLGSSPVTDTATGATATLSGFTLAVGPHQITATYNGDTSDLPSTSSAVPVTVNAAAVVVNSQNFGSVAVGQTVSMDITYPHANNPSVYFSTSQDFTVSNASCTSTCVVTITFTPRYPGLRNDFLTVKDYGGALVAQTYVYGTGTGPQLGFDFGVNTVYTNFSQQPTAVAFAQDSSYLIADPAADKVFYMSGSSNPLNIPNLGKPAGVALDASDTAYVVDQGNSVIRTFTAAGVAGTLATSPLSGPRGVAVDAVGSDYITDTGNNRIIKVDNAGNETTLVNSVANLGAIALDGAGDVYYATTSSPGVIVELPVTRGQAVQISNAVNDVHGLAIDASGRIYYADDNGISILNPATGALESEISGAGYPIGGVALNGAGNILFTQPTRGNYQISNRAQGNTTIFAMAGVSTQGTGIISNTGNAALTLQSLVLTGTVFTLDAANPCVAGTVIPAGGTCTLLIDYLAPGAEQDHQVLTVTSNSLNGAGTTNIFDVYGTATGAATSTTMLTVSSGAVSVGQAVSFTATVTYAPQPTGMVNFFDGTTMIGSASLGAGSGGSATAQFTTSTLAVGSHSITAMYVGNGVAPASVSGAQTVVVSQGTTTTGLSLSAANLTVGQTETLTANIVGGTSPALTGMVTFFDGTTSLGSITVTPTATGATATLSVATLAVGPHQIMARYSGDTNYVGGASAAQTVTVGQATSTTALAVSAANISVGQTETLTATVQGIASPGLTGSVTFFDGTAMLGSGMLTVNGATGTASLAVSTLAVGPHQITARYSGDTNYVGSTSAAQAITVAQIASATTLAISAANISVGQTETLTATVQGVATPGLTGSVTFYDGTAMLGSGTLTVNGATGTASLAVSTLGVGSHSITARYSGDTNYVLSTSAAQTVSVGQLTSVTMLAVSAANISVGQTETLTATVQGVATPGLTGSVTFFDGTAMLGSGTLTVIGATGTASLAVSTLAAGPHSITARYSGDTNYVISTSSAQTVTVGLVAQTITVAAIPNHVLGDAPFNVSATASSGLAVSLSVASGPATISGSTVTLTGAGTVVIQAMQTGNTTYAAATPVLQSFTVTLPVPTLVSITPATTVLGGSATPVTLTGTNFSTSDVVQLNGATVASTFVSATTLTAVIPATFLATAGTGQITVFDTVGKTTTAALPFVVTSAPTIVFTGPTSSAPAAQPVLTFTLVNPYPVAISGTLTLSFTGSGTAPIDDPNVQFSTGGRTIAFTIPALSTTTPTVQIQSGTVAGTATITLVVTANGTNVTPPNVTPVVISIPAVAPAITTTSLVRSGTTLSVVVQGYSNTRELSTAIFHFVPADGSSVSTPDITAPVTDVFAAWFASAASAQYGSAFTYTQDFTLNNDASTIKSVTVTLVNSKGNSIQETAQ